MNLTEARQLLEKSGYSVQKLDEFWFKKEIPETFDDYKNAVIQVFKKNPFSDLIAIVKLVDFFNYIVKDSFNNKEPVAKCAKNRALGIILTGMGGDGAKGLLEMRKAGARTIGQDESTCIVYGMPKVAFDIGAVEHQEKLNNIAKKTYAVLNNM